MNFNNSKEFSGEFALPESKKKIKLLCEGFYFTIIPSLLSEGKCSVIAYK